MSISNDDILRLSRASVPLDNDVCIQKCTCLANLWAGMGKIYKIDVQTKNGAIALVLKHICFPTDEVLSIGDARKVASYYCEAAFYECFSAKINETAGYSMVPALFHLDRSRRSAGELSICMEMLPGLSPVNFSLAEAEETVRAIAVLHSRWYGNTLCDDAIRRGVQQQGGYWYLDTRPDEWRSMPEHGWEGRLRKAAAAIDERLKLDSHQCLIHGDLKGSNMAIVVDDCNKMQISFCDFQYFGKSAAMKDIAYFFAVNLDASLLQQQQAPLLAIYHRTLCINLPSSVEPPLLDALAVSLELAYADICRWMAGWGYWGCVRYLQDRTRRLLDRLDGGRELPQAEAYKEAMEKAFPVG